MFMTLAMTMCEAPTVEWIAVKQDLPAAHEFQSQQQLVPTKTSALSAALT